MTTDRCASADSVRQARAVAAQRLARAGVPSPEVDAELLVRHVLGWGAAQLRVRGDEPLPAAAAATLDGLLDRRARREPLQLLLGSVGFRYLDLAVEAGVFIPRPETEVLAEQAIARTAPGAVVVEPCTGTGAVAIALATEAAPAEVHATDCDPSAVALARANAARCDAQVQVGQGDLLDTVPHRLRGTVDVLVANPPYVAAAETAHLPPEVACWDPQGALVAGPTGHEVSDRLLGLAGVWLAPGGWMLLEVDASRAHEAAERARERGLEHPRVVADLAGRDRVVVARRPT